MATFRYFKMVAVSHLGFYWPAYIWYKGQTSNGRWSLSSSVIVCNTPRRACRRLHPRGPGDNVMPPPV